MHSLAMFWKENQTTLKWYIGHVVIFSILYITRRHPTKLFETYPLPYLYVGMPWGERHVVDIELHIVDTLLRACFHFLVILYSLFVCTDIDTLILMHHYFWDSDTRIYHMLGRRDIRSWYVFHFFYFIAYSFGGATTRLMWVCIPRRIYIHVHVVLYYYLGVESEFGWYACMWRCTAGGFNIWLVWRLLLILRHISCTWFCVSCVAFTPSLGRSQTFVNPTGHARFFR